jgi:hypothetical protein
MVGLWGSQGVHNRQALADTGLVTICRLIESDPRHVVFDSTDAEALEYNASESTLRKVSRQEETPA